MAEIKSAQADAFVEKPDNAYRVFLLYGPDAGLVSERADTLAGRFGVDPGDPFSLIRLDADVVAADRSRLADEAHTVGMFGGQRIVRVSGVTRRNLADPVKTVLDHPPVDCRIIIEAGDLKRDAGLRKHVEKSKSGVAIACYPDGDREIDRLIASEMQAAGLSIDAEARQVLRTLLGSDRRASRNEITKLALYCYGYERVSAADVLAIIGDTAALAADGVIDAAIVGDIAALENTLGRVTASGVAPDMIVVAALRHFQTLQLARFRLDTGGAPAGAVVGSLRPPLHFSRRPAFERALRIWPQDRIEAAIGRLDRAALQARANSRLASAIADSTLLAVALEAARTARRQG